MELTPEERHTILHSLGLPRRWAYRNYYAVGADSLDPMLEMLCAKGFMACFRVNMAGMTYYRVTREGVKAAGVEKYVPRKLCVS